MKNLELYIEDGNGNKDRIDLFDYEAVNLNQKIKDVRDISKIFTDYSQSFKVPASSNNNRIFKHYYNYNIQDGFDARFKKDGLIQIGGADFRFGKIRLEDVDMRNNKPYAYKIVFFGSSVALAEILGDAELSNLNYLDKFNHKYDEDNVRRGLDTGLAHFLDSNGDDIMLESAIGDIVYPFISCSSYYYYSSANNDHGDPNREPTIGRNLHKHGNSAHNGIEYTDLRPSIKLKHIISGIEDAYPALFFDKTWIDSAPFNELYLHLNKDKGTMVSVNDNQIVFNGSDFGLDFSGIDGLYPIITNEYDAYTLTFSISPISGTGPYDIRVVDTISGDILGSANDLDGNGSVVIDYSVISSEEPRNWNLNFFVTTEAGSDLLSFDASLEMVKRYGSFANFTGTPQFLFFSYTTDNNQPPYTYTISGVASEFRIDVKNQVPKMKLIDFLQSIFKMFNLTAYFQRDESLPSKARIMIQPLDSYYSDGEVIDVSDYVDISESTISRAPTYSEISFKYATPKTFGIKSQNEVLIDEFGDLSRDNRDINNFVSDGGKYDVKLKFEHLLFERLSNENDIDDRTPIQTGWLVDSNQNTVKTGPIVHFAVSTPIDETNYRIAFTGATSTANPLLQKYLRPSNVSSDGSQTINFNSENDEYTGIENPNSLYQNYYKTYIDKAFSKSTRLMSVSANLPLSVLLRYSLRDVFRINALDYNINSLQTNLLTGKSKIELLNTNFAEVIIPETPYDIEVIPSSVTAQTFEIIWKVPITGIKATNYATYVDGVNHGYGTLTYPYTAPSPSPPALIKNLVSGQTYSIQVSSFSADGLESRRSAALITSTNTTSTTPTAPSNLSVVSTLDNSVLLTWTASTFDSNAGSIGYNVYVNQVSSGLGFLLHSTVSSADFTSNSFQFNVTSLSAGTEYEFKVNAFDSHAPIPNSGFSNDVTQTTTDSTDLIPPSVPTNFTASNITTTSVDLSWFPSFNPDGTAATGYKVYQSTTLIANITNTSHTVNLLISGTTYKFFVSSYDANGNESANAGPVKITTL